MNPQTNARFQAMSARVGQFFGMLACNDPARVMFIMLLGMVIALLGVNNFHNNRYRELQQNSVSTARLAAAEIRHHEVRRLYSLTLRELWSTKTDIGIINANYRALVSSRNNLEQQLSVCQANVSAEQKLRESDKAQYEARITTLQNEITFLRGQLSVNSNNSHNTTMALIAKSNMPNIVTPTLTININPSNSNTNTINTAADLVEYQGRLYGTRALSELSTTAWSTLGIYDIYVETLPSSDGPGILRYYTPDGNPAFLRYSDINSVRTDDGQLPQIGTAYGATVQYNSYTGFIERITLKPIQLP